MVKLLLCACVLTSKPGVINARSLTFSIFSFSILSASKAVIASGTVISDSSRFSAVTITSSMIERRSLASCSCAWAAPPSTPKINAIAPAMAAFRPVIGSLAPS